MQYRLVPLTTPDCDCEDCKAGRYLFNLQRLRDGKWCWAGTTMVTYSSVDDCRQHHEWQIQFPPGATWDDGTPILPIQELAEPPVADSGGTVAIDAGAFHDAVESLGKHEFASDSSPT